MIEDIKALLGDAASAYTDQQIELCSRLAVAEIKAYCKRELDTDLELAALRIAAIKLTRLNTEGLASQSFSGVNESYINGYPEDIKALLNSKRKLKLL